MEEMSIEEMEMRSWTRKLIWAWVFAVPIAFLMLSERVF